jgi:hypothetical protein
MMNQIFAIRIDDYPSGVRPIIDINRIRESLAFIDSLGVPYVLGIVPAICNEEDWEFLKKLKMMIPAMHGITHKYHEFSTVCISNQDFNNVYTIRQMFNELKGIPLKLRVKTLYAFRHYMNCKLETEVNTYIPPCNKLTILDSYFLRRAGFKTIYSQSRRNVFFLPVIRSDFYGLAKNYKSGMGTACLHITWEADQLNLDVLTRFFSHFEVK